MYLLTLQILKKQCTIQKINKSQIYKYIYNRITLLGFTLDTKYYDVSNEFKV